MMRFFGDLGFVLRYGELNVTVDGVRDQRGSFVFGIGQLRHELLDFKNELCSPLIAGLLHSALMVSYTENFLINLVAIGIDLLAAYFCFHHRIFCFPDMEFLEQIAASLIEIE